MDSEEPPSVVVIQTDPMPYISSLVDIDRTDVAILREKLDKTGLVESSPHLGLQSDPKTNMGSIRPNHWSDGIIDLDLMNLFEFELDEISTKQNCFRKIVSIEKLSKKDQLTYLDMHHTVSDLCFHKTLLNTHLGLDPLIQEAVMCGGTIAMVDLPHHLHREWIKRRLNLDQLKAAFESCIEFISENDHANWTMIREASFFMFPEIFIQPKSSYFAEQLLKIDQEVDGAILSIVANTNYEEVKDMIKNGEAKFSLPDMMFQPEPEESILEKEAIIDHLFSCEIFAEPNSPGFYFMGAQDVDYRKQYLSYFEKYNKQVKHLLPTSTHEMGLMNDEAGFSYNKRWL